MKDLPGTNTPAYDCNLKITVAKSFLTLVTVEVKDISFI
jgi:hypothetical protein